MKKITDPTAGDFLYGPLVKWLRQRPLTPLTSVRIRYGSPFFLLTESEKVNIMFVAANAVAIVGAY